MGFPVIGIVGCAGEYGRWLTRFFSQKMQLPVIGHDPCDPRSIPPAQMVQQADVLIFATPIRLSAHIVHQYIALAGGDECRQLWLDIC